MRRAGRWRTLWKIGAVLLILGSVLLWFGVTGARDEPPSAAGPRADCSTPSNPDCLPLPEVHEDYVHIALVGGAIAGAGAAFLIMSFILKRRAGSGAVIG